MDRLPSGTVVTSNQQAKCVETAYRKWPRLPLVASAMGQRVKRLCLTGYN